MYLIQENRIMTKNTTPKKLKDEVIEYIDNRINTCIIKHQLDDDQTHNIELMKITLYKQIQQAYSYYNSIINNIK